MGRGGVHGRYSALHYMVSDADVARGGAGAHRGGRAAALLIGLGFHRFHGTRGHAWSALGLHYAMFDEDAAGVNVCAAVLAHIEQPRRRMHARFEQGPRQLAWMCAWPCWRTLLRPRRWVLGPGFH